MNVTVYLGASEGRSDTLRRAVGDFGRWLGEGGHTLVYGGSRCGLMGILAESVLASGGFAIGVEPRFFVEAELQHEGLTELIVTEGMATRKEKMMALGDAFVAFPGGTGTLEEIAEVMSCVSLNLLHGKCLILNLDGYYNPLKEQLRRMIDAGLSTEERQSHIYFPNTLQELCALLQES